MANEQLLVTIGAKDSASNVIKKVNSELKYLDKEYALAKKSSNEFEKSQEGLQTKLTYLNNKYDTSKIKLDAYNKQLTEANKNIAKKKEEIENLSKAEGDNTKAIEKTEKQLEKYQAQMVNATRNINLTELEMSNLTKEINSTNTALENIAVDNYKKKMKDLASQVENSGQKISEAGQKITSIGNKLTLGATLPIMAAGTAMVNAGSDMEESLNKVEAVFKNNADKIKSWSKTTLDSLGIANTSALEYASTMGDLLKGIGFDDSSIVDMTKTIITMSADIASFKNSSPEEVFNAISAAMTGEREQLKKYGYVITDAILQEYAHTQGIKKKISEMTLQEKALLTLSKIQAYATDAQGDFSKTSDGNANSSKIFKESLKELSATFGQDLLPAVTPVIQDATKLIKSFSNLDEETRKNIIKMAMFTATLGPVTSVVGNVTKGVGGLVTGSSKLISKLGDSTKATEKFTKAGASSTTGVGKLVKSLVTLNPTTIAVTAGFTAIAGGALLMKKNNDLMNKSILYTTDEMSGLEKMLAKFNGTQKYSRKELEEMGLVYKEFSGSLSDNFKKKVEESTLAVHDFGLYLREINFDGVMTDTEVSEFNSRVDTAMSGALKTITDKQTETNKAMSDLFINDGVISENETKVLEFFSKNAETSKREVSILGEEIKELQKRINSSNSAEEIAQLEEEIKKKYGRIKELELQFVGSTAEEIAYAKNEVKARLEKADIEKASTLMQERAKLRDEEIVNIKASYDTQIEIMEASLEKMDEEQRAATQEVIDNTKLERDNKIKLANDTYNELFSITESGNSELAGKLNKYTGEVLSDVDQRCKAELETLKSHYKDLNGITESGMYDVYNEQSESWDKVVVKVDEATGEIIGMTRLTSNEGMLQTGKITGYNKEIRDSMDELQRNYVTNTNAIVLAMRDASGTSISSSGDIVNAQGKVIGALKEVTTAADGTRTGVLDLNGTPITITTNTAGAITNINEVKRQLAEVKSKTITITADYREGSVKGVGGYGNHLMYYGGTNNAQPGIHSVAEQGQEMIIDGSRTILTGDDGPQFYNFKGGEKVLNADQTRRVLTSGSYFNRGSFESRELVSTTNNISNTINNGSNSLVIDYNKLANVLVQAMQSVTIQSSDIVLSPGVIAGSVGNNFAMSRKRVR